MLKMSKSFASRERKLQHARRYQSRHAARVFAVLRVAHFPAERGNLSRNSSLFSNSFASRVLPRLCELRHFRGHRRFRSRFRDRERVLIRFHQSSHAARGRRVEFVFVHCTIRFANRFEQKSERRGNVQIVIKRVFELGSNWMLGRSDVGALDVCFCLQLRAVVPASRRSGPTTLALLSFLPR